MQIEKISYHKTFNLGNYSNERIGLDIVLSDGENPLDAFAEAKKQVEKSHKFFQEMPAYESAKSVMNDYDNHTGREIKAAEQLIKVFEENYPEYMSRFMPASRQLTESPVGNDYRYDDEDDDR
jgi:hypothetical protein